jgi:uncharacterized protein (TIGR02246 family)
MDAPDIGRLPRAAAIEAIKQAVAVLEHAQQNELVDQFVGLFRQDAIWTTGGGELLVGRDAISAFTHQVLPGAMGTPRPRTRFVLVLFVRADVAAVKVRQRPVTLDGAPIEDQPEGSPLYIMARRKGGSAWSLARTQVVVQS